jgi:hypothetical protein
MKKIPNYFKKFTQSLFLGILDALLPNIKESLKEIPSEFLNDRGELKIDFVRISSATVFFVLMILAICDVITFNDILKFINQWSLLLV